MPKKRLPGGVNDHLLNRSTGDACEEIFKLGT